MTPVRYKKALAQRAQEFNPTHNYRWGSNPIGVIELGQNEEISRLAPVTAWI